MAKKLMSTQCKLTQPTPGGHRIKVAWIPQEHARKGHWIDIEGEAGSWMVAETWGTRPEEDIIDHERDHKRQRDASDIDRVPSHLNF